MSSDAIADGARTWRGWSGREYGFVVSALAEAILREAGRCVALAVLREGSAAPKRLLASAFGTRAPTLSPRDWIALARKKGAAELHIHRPTTDEDLTEIAADLGEG